MFKAALIIQPPPQTEGAFTLEKKSRRRVRWVVALESGQSVVTMETLSGQTTELFEKLQILELVPSILPTYYTWLLNYSHTPYFMDISRYSTIASRNGHLSKMCSFVPCLIVNYFPKQQVHCQTWSLSLLDTQLLAKVQWEPISAITAPNANPQAPQFCKYSYSHLPKSI